MKIIKLFLAMMIIASSSPIESFVEDFDNNVKNAYDNYHSYYEYDATSYNIKIIRGKVNDELAYGISFYCKNSKEYSIGVTNEEDNYLFPTDDRGDVKCLAFYPVENGRIIIFDKSSNEAALPGVISVDVFDEEALNNEDILFKGASQGTKVISLSSSSFNLGEVMFFVGALIIVVFCAFILTIFFVKKKGKFNDEVRKEDVFNFKEFVEKEIKEDSRFIEAEVVNKEDSLKEEEIQVIDYGNNKRIYEDEPSGFNIKGYLMGKGFMTTYRILSDEEKNQIMLELMYLKDSKKITNDEYISEVSELWKK